MLGQLLLIPTLSSAHLGLRDHYVSAAKSLEFPKCISVLFCLQGNGCYPNYKQISLMVLHFQLMYDSLPLFENCAGL